MKTCSLSSSSDSIKENLSPTALNIIPSSKKTLIPLKNQKNIDEEIAEIEFEIERLTSKLKSLRLEKNERKIASEKRVSFGGGRIIAAKFMEPKKHAVVLNTVNEDTPKRNGVVFNTPKKNGVVLKDETPKSKINWRRGMSLGPVEIAGKIIPPAITPATLNRRKSCFGKPQENCSLDPVKVVGKIIPPSITPATVNRRKSCFVKPQESFEEQRRKTICKANSVAAIGSIKSLKKKEEEIVEIQPKKLFEGEKSVKKATKQGRVVASRYNSGGGVDFRKRSFCENNNNKGLGSEIRVKKRWEIPIEEVDVSGFVLLPKISTLRYVDDECARDSGAAKRVAELNGKKSYFCDEDNVILEEQEGSVCQVLNFADDDEEQG